MSLFTMLRSVVQRLGEDGDGLREEEFKQHYVDWKVVFLSVEDGLESSLFVLISSFVSLFYFQ